MPVHMREKKTTVQNMNVMKSLWKINAPAYVINKISSNCGRWKGRGPVVSSGIAVGGEAEDDAE